MVYLRSITKKPTFPADGAYPFDVPVIRGFDELEFQSPVTFLVGENGCGKSTLLEAIAVTSELPVVGGDDLRSDPSLAPARELAAALRLSWSKRVRRGFFLRAEDFFNYSLRMRRVADEMDELADHFDRTITGSGRQTAVNYMLGQKAAVTRRYGEDLNANSHGESFLKLFEARLVPGGLYLLDEPEVPLSPLRQLALLSLIKEFEREGAQFVIATHSPILMAYPGATILTLDGPSPREAAWEELEHVKLTRDFLKDPQAFLRHL